MDAKEKRAEIRESQLKRSSKDGDSENKQEGRRAGQGSESASRAEKL